jgi:hypothetical protein
VAWRRCLPSPYGTGSSAYGPVGWHPSKPQSVQGLSLKTARSPRSPLDHAMPDGRSDTDSEARVQQTSSPRMIGKLLDLWAQLVDRMYSRWVQDPKARRFLSRAVVVFACTPADAATIDVAVGPCQPRWGPRGGRLRPLALPSSQSYSTTFEHLASLYSTLTNRPTKDAVSDVRRVGPGTVGRLTEHFVEALTAVRLRSMAEFENGAEPFQVEHEIGQRWISGSRWPQSMRVGGLAMRIFDWSVECEKATEKHLQVFCWEGPAVAEYVIAHGTSRESYEAYRKANGR